MLALFASLAWDPPLAWVLELAVSAQHPGLHPDLPVAFLLYRIAVVAVVVGFAAAAADVVALG